MRERRWVDSTVSLAGHIMGTGWGVRERVGHASDPRGRSGLGNRGHEWLTGGAWERRYAAGERESNERERERFLSVREER